MEIMPLEPDGLDWGFEPRGDGGLRASSPVYNDLVNQSTAEFLDQFAETHGPRLMNLTRLWNVAGKPAGKSPSEWLSLSPFSQRDEVADHGDEGWGAAWDVAVWYASFLDARVVPHRVLSGAEANPPRCGN
jgi:hypothetical protein